MVCAGAKNRPPPSSYAFFSQWRWNSRPGQRPVEALALEVLHRDRDHDAGVGVLRVAARVAHAVGALQPVLGRRGHHDAARAHAERVDAAHLAVRPRGSRRACSRRAGSFGFFAAAPYWMLVDEPLRVLGAEADARRAWPRRSRARPRRSARTARAPSCPARAPPGRSPACARRDSFTPATAAVAVEQVLDPRLEAHLAAAGDELLAQPRDRARQQVRADVRLALDQDAVRRAVAARRSRSPCAPCGWLMRVESLPSVYAPAPPSPKFMLLSGSSDAVAHQLGHVFAARAPPRGRARGA